MYLKKLEIQGFKSFAHKTVLEFDRGIISIVGPNGSGKSNFADAIRWVLGEQSMKAVRSKKSEDVIFAGSDKKSRLGMAEVAITFDNADRRLPLDFSEVVITRRIYRDSEAEYLLNHHPVRLMDIVDLLAKSGYGNNSYHVISQGSIDQMVIAGPMAIKNLIEEASGVKTYYLKRERTVRKLSRSEQNLARVADLVAEIEPRLRSLRRQAKKLEQREELAAELQTLQINYFSSQYHAISRNAVQQERQVSEFDRGLNKLSSEIETATKEVKKLESATAEKSQSYSKLQDDLRRTEKEKNIIQEQLAMVRGQLKAKTPVGQVDSQLLRERQIELKREEAELTGRLQDLSDHAVLEEKNLADHEKIFTKLGSEIEKLRKILDSEKSPVDFEKLKADVEKIYSRYQSLLYEIKNLKTEDDFQQLREDASNLEIVLVKLKNHLMQYSGGTADRTSFSELSRQLQKAFEQRERFQAELLGVQTRLAATRSQQEFFTGRLVEVRRELERVERELGKKGAVLSADAQLAEMIREENKLNSELQKYFTVIRKLEEDLAGFLNRESADKKSLLELERELRTKQDSLSKIKDQRGLILIEKARNEAHLENLFSEVRKSLGHDYVEKVRSSIAAELEPGTESKIQKFRAQLELIGGVDELIVQEYRETEQRYNYLTSQSKDLQTAVGDLKKVITELDAIIKRQFQNGFDKINELFGEYFRILFSGGKARMTLLKQQINPVAVKTEEEEGATSEEAEEIVTDDVSSGQQEVVGIDVRATPPGKKLASLSALSGGERTLTAIALLMSILTAFPSPFVVLDEVDAALDEANSIRFGKILSKLSHQTQFLTITHNRETMRQAGALYGITMGDDGISKVLSIKLEKAVEIAAQGANQKS